MTIITSLISSSDAFFMKLHGSTTGNFVRLKQALIFIASVMCYFYQRQSPSIKMSGLTSKALKVSRFDQACFPIHKMVTPLCCLLPDSQYLINRRLAAWIPHLNRLLTERTCTSCQKPQNNQLCWNQIISGLLFLNLAHPWWFCVYLQNLTFCVYQSMTRIMFHVLLFYVLECR